MAIHECEPTLEELYKLQKELFVAESTNENMRKLQALQKQIERHESHKKEVEAKPAAG